MAVVEVRGARRVHEDGTVALAGVDLDLALGEVVALLGPSGSGKTTLLRAIAGSQPLSGGRVVVAGVDITGARSARRGVAIATDPAALGMILDDVDLLAGGGRPTRGHRRPVRHSRTRTAWTPPLTRVPSVLLADDPGRRLEAAGRRRMARRLRDVARRTGMAVLLATHDHAMAASGADRQVLLRDGRIAAEGTPVGMRAAPADAWVAGFLCPDPMTFASAVVIEEGGIGYLELAGQRVRMPGGLPGPLRALDGAPVLLGARPTGVVEATADDDADRQVTAVVRRISLLGPSTDVEVDVGSGCVTARFSASEVPEAGQTVSVAIDGRRLSVFDMVTEQAIWHGDHG